jgi:hypothetical protein
MSRRNILATVFGVVYYASIIVGDAYAAGSTWRAGIGHALLFGTFFFIISYPILLLVQHLLFGIARRMLRKPSAGPSIWAYIPCVLISMLFFSAAIPRSPESYFEWFVADPVPPSVSDIEYWHTSGYGNSGWIITFRISPDEFDQILSMCPYKERFVSEGEVLRIPEGAVTPPREPLVHCYSYSEPGPGGGLLVDILANENKDRVYVIGLAN